MNIYGAPNYRQFMEATINGDGTRVWGAVKKLAAALKCHSTYVSQIIKGKADLSTEQALAFCRQAKLSRDESEFFLDLVNRDKAGNEETREHFQTRIDRRLSDRENLKNRLKLTDTLTIDQEARYYDGWLPQAVHICCQLTGSHTAAAIANRLELDRERVEGILRMLTGLGLVEQIGAEYRSACDSVHLGKESPLISRFHSNWRLKTVSDMMATAGLPGTHYSSVMSMSVATAKSLHELILQHVEASRGLVLPSPPDELYVYCMDFYPLTRPAPNPA